MFLERRTFFVKPGCTDEAIRLSKDEQMRVGVHAALYTAVYGPLDVLLYDLTAESQGAIEKMWADWGARPETPKFMEQWNRLTAGGGTCEMWKEHLGNPNVSTKYIERRTFTIKSGHTNEALQLMKAELERPPKATNAYLYTAVYGSFDTIIMDGHFDDPKVMERGWAEWEASPAAPVFFEKWSPLVVTGKRELWVQQ